MVEKGKIIKSENKINNILTQNIQKKKTKVYYFYHQET